MTPGRSPLFTRRRVLTGLGVGFVAAGVSGTGAFESVEAPRTSTIQVVGDSNAILALQAFKESKTYESPHEVTVTNDTGVDLSDNMVSSATGKLEFQQGQRGPNSELSLDELPSGESGTFKIITASGETDDVTLSYAQPDKISIEVTREITVLDPIGGLVYAISTNDDSDDTKDDDNDIRVYDADQKEERRPPNSTGPNVIGAGTTHFTAGPNADIAFATSKGMHLTEVDGSDNNIDSPDHGILREKTRLALGKWPGIDDSNSNGVKSNEYVILYASESKEIYAMDADGNTEKIVNPSNGAAGVVGVADIDNDGKDEMVFLGSSNRKFRYLNQNGTISKMGGIEPGSNNSTGFGPPASFKNFSNIQVPFIDGSNQPSLVDYEGTTTTLVNSDDAKKATCAPFDIDDDEELEFVFIGTGDNGTITYVDDVGGDNNVKELKIDGNTRSPDVSTGLNSGTQTN